jgi:hypothetical protein
VPINMELTTVQGSNVESADIEAPAVPVPLVDEKPNVALSSSSRMTPDIDLRHTHYIDHVLPLLSVACFSYLGVWARVLTGKFSESVGLLGDEPNYANVVVLQGKGFWLANVLGCCVMGFMSSRQAYWSNCYPRLYTGITTGFCGCCTTFATWNGAVSGRLYTHPSDTANILFAMLGDWIW